MKRNLATMLFVAGAALAPVAGYAAETQPGLVATTKQAVKETAEDAKITSRIKAAFAKDKAVSVLKIHVNTDNGTVRLSGRAKSQAEIEQAIAIAKSTEGVTSVQNEMQVGTTNTSKKSGVKQASKDTMITTKVKAKYAQDPLVNGMKIRTKTTNGVVHLTGKAKNQEEIDKAVQLAQSTEGVVSVKNQVRIIGHKAPAAPR